MGNRSAVNQALDLVCSKAQNSPEHVTGIFPGAGRGGAIGRRRRRELRRKADELDLGTVAALNRAEQTKDKNTRNNDPSSLAGVEFSKLFPPSLLEMDEYAVKEAVSSITSPEIRVQVRLGLLSVCLARLRDAKQATPNPRRAVSKGD